LAPFFYSLAKPVKAVLRWAIEWLNRQPQLAAWVCRLFPRRIIDWLRLRLGDATGALTEQLNPVTFTATRKMQFVGRNRR